MYKYLKIIIVFITRGKKTVSPNGSDGGQPIHHCQTIRSGKH